MDLNKDQLIASTKIEKFINSNDHFFMLEGVAGTGKTFLITELFKIDRFSKYKIVFSATTNKAVSVLESNYKSYNKSISFITIQKLLQIKRYINEDGKEKYNYNDNIINTTNNPVNIYNKNYKSIDKYDIIIIDEVSMINYELLNKLNFISKLIKGKIILIGDRNQLPPINEKISSVFAKNYKCNKFILTKIERYKNDIVKYSSSIINNIQLKSKVLNPSHILFTKSFDKWIAEYLSAINNSIILSYTNSNRSKINKHIRKVLFPNETKRFTINEKIIFNTYYRTLNTKFYSSQISTIIDISEEEYKFNNIDTNSLLNLKVSLKNTQKNPKKILLTEKLCPICFESDIDEMEQTRCDHLFCSKCIKIWLKENKCCPLCRCNIVDNEIEIKDCPNITTLIMEIKNKLENLILMVWKIDLPEDTITIISDSSLEKYKNLCSIIESKLNTIKDLLYKKKDKFNSILLIRLWEFYYENVIDVIANIDYGYCITIHKSQGSTYSNVFVDIQNIIKNNKTDTKQCVYTAITRASNKLIILK